MKTHSPFFCRLILNALLLMPLAALHAAEPKTGDSKRLDLGDGVTLEVVYLPPGEFMMGSTPEEKAWATGIEGGAQPGTNRESFEGEQPRMTRVKHGFWMGRTEVSVGQFRRFALESKYVTDAERPDGKTQVFDLEWDGYRRAGGKVIQPWKPMPGKSWRDPNWGFPNRDDFPVVCVSYNDMNAFCQWLTGRERKAGRLPEGLEYRLPAEAEWEYGCRGGSKESHYFWWGNDLEAGEGRLNISAIDFLPGRTKTWPVGKAPWSDGFPFVSPVDHYGEKGRNGFGLADMCGGVWEFVIDHFDPKGGHEEIHYENAEKRTVSRPVCRGGNYFDVPGNARCAVRLGISSVTYSDSRDGFRICLGTVVPRLAALAAAEPSLRLADNGFARHAIVIAAFPIVKEGGQTGSGIYAGQTRKATELASILERWVRKNGCCNPPDEFLDSMARAEIDSQSSAEKWP